MGVVGPERPQPVAVLLQVDHTLQEAGVGRVSDGHEEPADGELALLARDGVLQLQPGDHVVAHDVGHDRVPREGDLLVRHRLRRHDLGGAELVATMNDHHFPGELRQVQGVLHRGVSAPDHREHLIAEVRQSTVADRARADATARLRETLFVRQPEPVGVRPGREDHGVGQHHLAAGRLEAERVLVLVDGDDVFGQHARAEPDGLLLHLHHERLAIHAVLEARVVLDLGREHELPPGNHGAADAALDNEGVHLGTGGVDGGGPARRAGADDHHALVGRGAFGHRHSSLNTFMFVEWPGFTRAVGST